MKARKTKTNVKLPEVKSTMLTLRITPEVLDMIMLTMRIMSAERSMGSKAPTRSEAVELLIRWGWKTYEAQNSEAAAGLKKLKKSA